MDTPVHSPAPSRPMQFPVAAVILILMGALFLAAQYGHVNPGTFVLKWWPLVVVAIGATQMVNDRRVLSPGITLVLTGAFLLFFTLGGLKWRMFAKIWPIVLIAVGASMLIGARRGK